MKRKNKFLQSFLLFILFILTTVLVIALLFLFTDKNDEKPLLDINSNLYKLTELGYDEKAANKIEELEITDVILKEGFYTNELNESLKLDNYNHKYFEIYKFKSNITKDEEKLFDALTRKGYNTNQIADLYNSLAFYEITPLLVYDYQSDLSTYFQDIEKNSAYNSNYYFYLDNSYHDLYGDTKPSENHNSLSANVSKTYYLPSDYIPGNLIQLPEPYAYTEVLMVEEAANAFMKLVDDASALGYSIFANNAYRSYDYQYNLFNYYVGIDGEEIAETYSARPGFSEHQTGLALDVDSLDDDLSFDYFGQTKSYIWMKDVAHTYGFIQRYPNDKEDITGYIQEEWHWRYLGVDLATKVYYSNLTYDEYFELNKE